MKDQRHPSHVTRMSDASSFDEICTVCGARDIAGGGWGDLAKPCPGASPIRLFKRTDTPDDSTLYCPCGEQFTWSGSAAKELRTWINEHWRHAVETPPGPVLLRRAEKIALLAWAEKYPGAARLIIRSQEKVTQARAGIEAQYGLNDTWPGDPI